MAMRRLVSAAIVVAMLPALVPGVAGAPQAPAEQKPQVVTALGKSYFARADADGSILGLAYFLTARFPAAARTYQGCLDRKAPGTGLPAGWRDCAALSAASDRDDESRIGISDWLYRSLRRAGRHEEAGALLRGIPEGLPIKENEAYYRALLFCKGGRTEADVLPAEAFKENTGVTVGYGLANFYLAEGQTAKACALLRRLVEDEAHWNAFGFIGAEADLTRANGPCAAAK